MNVYIMRGRYMRAMRWSVLPAIAVMMAGCEGFEMGGGGPAGPGASYRSDVAFLRGHAKVIELAQGSGRLAIVPALQGRVMTSGFSPGGASLGWVPRKDIEAGEQDVPFNNFGGQDRFWLGPEGGQFSLYFAQGAEQVIDNWQVPAAFNGGPFEVVAQDDRSVEMRAEMSMVNASGTKIDLEVGRTIRSVPLSEAEGLFRTGLAGLGVGYLGYVSENRITNTGEGPLTEETGTVSIWSMGMFAAGPDTVVVAPFDKAGEGLEIQSSYFGEPPAERLKLDGENGVALFRADGRFRSKIGIPVPRARDRIGSIDFARGVLTIVQFDLTSGQNKYVNSLWAAKQDAPFAGDVANSYNDGGDPDATFYEVESSSPAAFLAPGQSLAHHHRTLQFRGSLEALSKISEKVLGVGLEHVRHQME